MSNHQALSVYRNKLEIIRCPDRRGLLQMCQNLAQAYPIIYPFTKDKRGRHIRQRQLASLVYYYHRALTLRPATLGYSTVGKFINPQSELDSPKEIKRLKKDGERIFKSLLALGVIQRSDEVYPTKKNKRQPYLRDTYQYTTELQPEHVAPWTLACG